MSWQDTPRCPRCKRWAYPGQRHVCTGDLRRCANPHCRRLLPELFHHDSLCIRCRVKVALAQADGLPPTLPVNTGRGGRRR